MAAKEVAKEQATDANEDLEIKAPFTHFLLLAVACAPLLVGIPANLNIVLLPTLTLFAGAWRSVKLAPPTEAMTQKDAMQFPLIGRRECVTRSCGPEWPRHQTLNIQLRGYCHIAVLHSIQVAAASLGRVDRYARIDSH